MVIVTIPRKIPETSRVGYISLSLYLLMTSVYIENDMAHKRAKTLPKKLFESRLSDTIIIIPNSPISIITIFLGPIFSLKKINAKNAEIKGIELKVNKVFPIEVKANA